MMLAGVGAQAQEWPTKPVRLIVPFTAGGGTDTAARMVADHMTKALGQPVLVENKTGAGGAIATDFVSESAPDGHILMFGTLDTQILTPVIVKTNRHDPGAMPAVAPGPVLSVAMCGKKGAVPATFTELVERAKKQPMTYGHWGRSGTGYIGMEVLKQRTGLQNLVDVPFPGSPQILQAVLGGHVDLLVLPMNVVMSNRASLECYGVMAPKRFQRANDIPTFTELGHPIDIDGWIGVFAPPKTPPRIIAAAHRAINSAMVDLREKFLDVGATIMETPTAEAWGTQVTRDRTRWLKMIQDSGLKLSN